MFVIFLKSLFLIKLKYIFQQILLIQNAEGRKIEIKKSFNLQVQVINI